MSKNKVMKLVKRENINRTYTWVYILTIHLKRNMRKGKEGNIRRERG